MVGAAGALGVPEAFKLRDAVATMLEQSGKAVVDLSKVESLGAPCVQMLYMLWVEAISWGVDVEISSVSDPAFRSIAACGLTEFFGIHSGGRGTAP